MRHCALLWHQIVIFVDGFAKSVVHAFLKTDFSQEPFWYWVKTNTKLLQMKFIIFHNLYTHSKGATFIYILIIYIHLLYLNDYFWRILYIIITTSMCAVSMFCNELFFNKYDIICTYKMLTDGIRKLQTVVILIFLHLKSSPIIPKGIAFLLKHPVDYEALRPSLWWDGRVITPVTSVIAVNN